MPKKRIFALMLWSATLAATGAVADVAQVPLEAETLGVAAQSDTDEAAARRVLEQFRSTQVSLNQAMAIAEHLHDGSRTADISFEISEPPAYRVRTVKNDRIWENVVHANTGGIAGKEVTLSLKQLDRDDLANIIALKSVKLELLDAVRVAEDAEAGRALAAGLTKQDGKLNFVVVVAKGDRFSAVLFEPPEFGKQGSTRHYPRHAAP
jgi:uncharacterized membrane protein YkoI